MRHSPTVTGLLILRQIRSQRHHKERSVLLFYDNIVYFVQERVSSSTFLGILVTGTAEQ